MPRTRNHRKYRRNRDVPHWDLVGRMQFLTIRQADSLPRDVIQKLLAIDDPQRNVTRLNEYLDAGFGSCILGERHAYEIVEDSLKWWHDAGRMRLDEYVIMPNHVHFNAEPLVDLERLMHSLKSFTANRIREMFPGEGAFWQRSYFDRIIRDEEHLHRARRYIRANPKMAGLVEKIEDWPSWS